MAYRRAIVPGNPGDLPRFLDRELREIGNAVDQAMARTPTPVLYAASDATQDPTGTGAANTVQITFGAAQGDATSLATLDAAGAIRLADAGSYGLTLILRPYRNTSPNIAALAVRLMVNGSQWNRPITAALNNAGGDQAAVVATWQLTVDGPTVLAFEMGRDAAGENDGGLRAYTSTMGWGITPSAVIEIVKY